MLAAGAAADRSVRRPGRRRHLRHRRHRHPRARRRDRSLSRPATTTSRSARRPRSKLAPEFIPSVVPTIRGAIRTSTIRAGPTGRTCSATAPTDSPAAAAPAADISARFGRLGPHPPDILRTLVTLVLVGLPLGAALPRSAVVCRRARRHAAFWGGLLLAMVGGPHDTFIAPLAVGAAGVACLAGASRAGAPLRCHSSRTAVTSSSPWSHRLRSIAHCLLERPTRVSPWQPVASARRSAMSLRGRTAIAGLGITEQGKVYDRSHVGFAVEAVRLALDGRRARRAAISTACWSIPGSRWGDCGMGVVPAAAGDGAARSAPVGEHELRRRDRRRDDPARRAGDRRRACATPSPASSRTRR